MMEKCQDDAKDNERWHGYDGDLYDKDDKDNGGI
jgi:hypothetical protein